MRRDFESGIPQVLGHADGGVGWITINNPTRHNALTHEMFEALPRLIAQFAGDEDTRVVVVRGAGDDAFVSGADISTFAERRQKEADRREFDRVGTAMMDALSSLTIPVIAMIRGWCLGGGLLLALRAD